MLGPRHPDTLDSLNNLALLYQNQGRYGEAEPIYKETLQARREVLGPRHPDTLTSLNNLAFLYEAQHRYADAEPLFKEALQARREVLGPRHPDTLDSLNNLAALYDSQGRYGEAEALYQEALQARREVLGQRHRDTLTSLNNLAVLYFRQSHYGEAEPLFKEALQERREVLGQRHPDTLDSLNNLAGLYDSQGRYGEAEPLYREALEGAREALGVTHPSTLLYELNAVFHLAAQGWSDAAVQQLQVMEPQLLSWLGAELYSNENAGVRRQLVASQRTFQDAALSLALLPGTGVATAQLAASAVLRFKGLQADEEVYLARISRRGADPQARQLAAEIAELHSRLAQIFQSGAGREVVEALTGKLEAKELALGRISRNYAQHLQVRSANLVNLRASLPPRAGLLEIRQYRPVNFQTRKFGPSRWASILLREADTEVLVRDLGPVEASKAAFELLLREPESSAGQKASHDLYQQLIGPMAAQLAELDRIYIAPDGELYLMPFAALRAPDGKRMAELADVRLLLTGRDLMRPEADKPAMGLLALGGIDFGDTGQKLASASLQPAVPVLSEGQTEHLRSLTQEVLRSGFGPLPNSGAEVETIAGLYRVGRRSEPVEVWTGANASEARLRAREQAPRVLHLATHGFYRPRKEAQERPLLMAGVALAGANKALHGTESDGILYAIEAQDLNLEGTELVVLSACKTAQGQIDYGEGISGLVRALRTAGARYVLVTLQPVGDFSAGEFMQRFYYHWLDQIRSDPAAALQAAQREYLQPGNSDPSTQPIWAQFILVGG